MRRTGVVLLVSVVCLSVACLSVPASGATTSSPLASKGPLPNFTFTGSPGATALIQPGYMSKTAAQITTTGDGSGGLGTWGAVDLAIPNNLKLRQINQLSTEYEFTLGSCWGGSPRFELWIPDPSSPTGHAKIFLYIGPLPSWVGCAMDTWSSTGNLANLASTADDAQDNQLSGVPGYIPWAQVVKAYGGEPVSAVYVDADGGWDGEQVIEFDDTRVDGNLVTYEPH